MIREHERVVLGVSVPAEKVEAGDVGTVLHACRDGMSAHPGFIVLTALTILSTAAMPGFADDRFAGKYFAGRGDPKNNLFLAGAPELAGLAERVGRLRRFHDRLTREHIPAEYEMAHARLAADCYATILNRQQHKAEGKITPLPEKSQAAADKLYVDTAARLCDGLAKTLDSHERSEDPRKQQIGRLWRETQ